jgi:protein gp37
MQPSDIAWTTYTWNPVTGCTRHGPECSLCWAETMTKRQATRENPPEYATEKDWLPQNAEEVVTLHEDRIDEPREYGYPGGDGYVFTVSMGDLFHREVPREFIERVLDTARACPEQTFQFLTKRPGRAAELRLDWPDNAWVGTSVGSGPGGEYPNTTHRIEQLRAVDAPVLWLSVEPLIEPLGEVALDHINWMVVGGETGSEADRREMEHAWARELLRQCREQDVAYFFKQSSARYPETGTELTVEREVGGVQIYQQEQIREMPGEYEVPR